jgi:membrane dipeptidase
MTLAPVHAELSEHARDLHFSSIVVDAVCPLLRHFEYLDNYRAGGATAVAPTVGDTEPARPTLDRIARWLSLIASREDLVLAKSTADIERAKRDGRTAVYFHFQGTDPIERNLELVDLYKMLGVGIVQLTYNVRNAVGSGCEEADDAGLTDFGREVVAKLNQARIVIDCSHTGEQTSLEAIERSSAPVVLSHSNARSVYPSPRNVSDRLIDAIAGSGGLVGLVGFPGLIGPSTRPGLDELIAHLDAIVARAGIDSVGLGIDYYAGQAGVVSDHDAMKPYRQYVEEGLWGASYPPPPHHYPQGIEMPEKLPHLTDRLLRHGYGDDEVRKILGLNWLRVLRAVWGH